MATIGKKLFDEFLCLVKFEVHRMLLSSNGVISFLALNFDLKKKTLKVIDVSCF